MVEETKPKEKKEKKEKPPAIEDKPFTEFIEQHFVPTLKESLNKEGLTDIELSFTKAPISIVGASTDQSCSQIIGTWSNSQRQFIIYFPEESINGQKAFSFGHNNKFLSTLESFMIDERKVTLNLLVLYTLQRITRQK